MLSKKETIEHQTEVLSRLTKLLNKKTEECSATVEKSNRVQGGFYYSAGDKKKVNELVDDLETAVNATQYAGKKMGEAASALQKLVELDGELEQLTELEILVKLLVTRDKVND